LFLKPSHTLYTSFLKCLLAYGFLFCTLLYPLEGFADLRSEQDNLRNLQKRIQQIQKKVVADTKELDQTLNLVAKIDKQIDLQQNEIRSLETKISAAEENIRLLDKVKNKALSELSTEQKHLGAILQIAHRQNGSASLKWLLDQEDPSKLARVMTYYKYLAQNQNKQIEYFANELSRYIDVIRKAKSAKTDLQILFEQNQTQFSELKEKRLNRQSLIAKLESNISAQQDQVKSLTLEEQSLQKIINELEAALADFPDDTQISFASLKGKLEWPVEGKIQNVYGNYRIPKQGLRWRGLQIKTQRNTEIKAIAYGRVVYADWLPGMGLISIVDHGDGYLSLYGNCEAIFKEVGEWVNAGEVLALVGDSGGQNGVGLYLELRKGKRPFSPQSWFKTRRP